MKRFGYLYGNAGRRKFRLIFSSEFDRNMFAAADRSLGYRVRKFDLKPEPAILYYGA